MPASETLAFAGLDIPLSADLCSMSCNRSRHDTSDTSLSGLHMLVFFNQDLAADAHGHAHICISRASWDMSNIAPVRLREFKPMTNGEYRVTHTDVFIS